MIGLDANILLRYLTQDDPIQSPKATALIEDGLSEGNPGFISIVAMVETVWVLDRHYHFRRDQIAMTIEGLLRADSLVIDHEQDVFEAMAALRDRRGEFADALIGVLSLKAGCSRILTFDGGTGGLPGFELL